MARAKRTPRATDIMLIKIGVKQLGLDESTERDMYFGLTGLRHVSEMDHGQRAKILKHLQSRGFKLARRPSARTADDPVTAKIRALWGQLASDKVVRDGSDAALRAFVLRQTGVQALDWLSSEQARSVIEALKSWRNRMARGAAAA